MKPGKREQLICNDARAHAQADRPHRYLAFALALLVCLATTSCAQDSTQPETGKMSDSPSDAAPLPFAASRPAPPRVSPLGIDGIRYEQVLNAQELGESQRTGFLAAYREADGEHLWHLRVYALENIDYLEADAQDVFFTRMERIGERAALLIENERGDRFEVDLEARTSVPVP